MLLIVPGVAWPRTVAIDVGNSLARPGATSARGVAEFEFNHALAEIALRSVERRKRVAGAIAAALDRCLVESRQPERAPVFCSFDRSARIRIKSRGFRLAIDE